MFTIIPPQIGLFIRVNTRFSLLSNKDDLKQAINNLPQNQMHLIHMGQSPRVICPHMMKHMPCSDAVQLRDQTSSCRPEGDP